MPWFVCEFGLGPSVCRTIPRPRRVGSNHTLGSVSGRLGLRIGLFPRDRPSVCLDSRVTVTPPSFRRLRSPLLLCPSPLSPSIQKNQTVRFPPSPARAILPPMRDSFAPAPSSSPRPLAGSPAQAPTEPARTAPTPANPTHLPDANQGKPRKTKPAVPAGADGPPTFPALCRPSQGARSKGSNRWMVCCRPFGARPLSRWRVHGPRPEVPPERRGRAVVADERVGFGGREGTGRGELAWYGSHANGNSRT